MAEAIDWVAALAALGASALTRRSIVISLGALAKSPDDRDTVLEALDGLGYPAASA